MLLLLLTSTAIAQAPLPDGPLARAEQPLRVRRYVKVVGGGPVWPRWRKRSGPIEAWVFPDWQILQYRTWKARQLLSEHRFDAHGDLRSHTTYGSDGAPTAVTLHGLGDEAETLDVSAWSTLDVFPLTTRSAVPPTATGPHRHWDGSTYTVTLSVFPEDSDDPLTDTFRTRLARECGCTLIDRHSAWVDGRAGVRYRVEIPDLDTPVRGDVWAFSQHGHLVVLTAVQNDDRDARRTARALLALMRWQEPREPK